uniref:Protein FAR1-RELATED SEQUENCE n=1 Tax=Kalanchoe fedtschenkoi TaxID=63787 RepID=A0A7N0TZ37_KALFE
MRDLVLAGMSTPQRSDSVNSSFDKYLHKKTSVQDFIKQHEAFLQDRYDEEARADSDPWNKLPITKSPSPLEKHMSVAYTHAVFKKGQVELLGAIACHPKPERQEGAEMVFRVQDVEKKQEFAVAWNELKAEISCVCRLFEYKGFLCRHAMIVLQICGQSQIPSHYILKRWAKDAKMRPLMPEAPLQAQSRVHRYDDLCQRAMRLGEEAALSQESYEIAFRAIDEALSNCVAVNNNSGRSSVEAGMSSASHGLRVDEENQSLNKMSKKKNSIKKRKVTPEPDDMTVEAQNLQQMVCCP